MVTPLWDAPARAVCVCLCESSTRSISSPAFLLFSWRIDWKRFRCSLEVRWSRREKSIQSECSEKKNLANSQVKVPTSLPPVQYKKDTNKKKQKKIKRRVTKHSKMPVDICSQPHNLLSSLR